MASLVHRPGLWLAALLAMVVGVYLPAFEGDFIWDDAALIVNNRYIKDWRHLGRNLTHTFWDVGTNLRRKAQRSYYRPIISLSFMVDYAAWGLSPRGYHLSNLVFHLIAVVLFWLLLRRLAPRGPPWSVALVAALFALHPTRAEAVYWISGRSDLLMSVFFLAAILVFARTAQRAGAFGYVMTLVFAALSMGSKESAVALIVVLPLYEWLLTSREGRRQRLLFVHAPLIGLGIAFIVLRLGSEGAMGAPLGISGRLSTIAASIGHYAQLLVWPYAPDALRGADFVPARPGLWLVGLGALSVVVVGLLAWRWRRERAGWSWALLFSAATLAPAANLVTQPGSSLVAERFTYLPLAGVALLWGWAMAEGLRSEGRGVRRTALGACGLLLLLLVTWIPVTYARGYDYSSPHRFWSTAHKRWPQHGLPSEKLAWIAARRGKLDEAAQHCLDAIAANRASGEAQAVVDLQLGLLEIDIARLPPADGPILHARARDLARLGGLARAESRGSVTIGLPTLGRAGGPAALSFSAGVSTRRVLAARGGDLLTWRGTLLSRVGDDAQALTLLRRARAAEKRSVPALLQLIWAELRALHLQQAEALLKEAGMLVPGDSALDALGERIGRVRPLIRTLAASGPRREAQLAEIQLLLAAPARAVLHLRRVISARPDDRQSWAKLIITLSEGGARKAALEVLAEARARFGDEPGLMTLLRKVQGM